MPFGLADPALPSTAPAHGIPATQTPAISDAHQNPEGSRKIQPSGDGVDSGARPGAPGSATTPRTPSLTLRPPTARGPQLGHKRAASPASRCRADSPKNRACQGALARRATGAALIPKTARGKEITAKAQETANEALERAFLRAWSPTYHEAYQASLKDFCGGVGANGVRWAERPIFLPEHLLTQLKESALAIAEQLAKPECTRLTEAFLPEQYRDARGRGELPNVAVIDFAVARDDEGLLTPRLLEAQAFPTSFVTWLGMGKAWETELGHMGLKGPWSFQPSELSETEYLELMRKTILGNHAPENVVMLDVCPEEQKTLFDFGATAHWLGVKIAGLDDLGRDGDKLYYVDDQGKKVPVHRIYNRVVPDELERADVEAHFGFNEPLEVDGSFTPSGSLSGLRALSPASTTLACRAHSASMIPGPRRSPTRIWPTSCSSRTIPSVAMASTCIPSALTSTRSSARARRARGVYRRGSSLPAGSTIGAQVQKRVVSCGCR